MSAKPAEGHNDRERIPHEVSNPELMLPRKRVAGDLKNCIINIGSEDEMARLLRSRCRDCGWHAHTLDILSHECLLSSPIICRSQGYCNASTSARAFSEDFVNGSSDAWTPPNAGGTRSLHALGRANNTIKEIHAQGWDVDSIFYIDLPTYIYPLFQCIYQRSLSR